MLALGLTLTGAVLLSWFLCFSHLNRKRAERAAGWIRNALQGYALAGELECHNPCEYLVRLRAPASPFRQPTARIRLHPRQMPLLWLLNKMKRQPESLIFEANLDCPPAFSLAVQNHRWTGRAGAGRRNFFALGQAGPFVLATRTDWQREITSMMTALVASRECELLSIEFRREPPHFTAIMPLHALSPQSPASSEFFEVLRELASCGSASRF